MKIAIDESGDTGRRFWAGSTPWFVVAAVIVPDRDRKCGLTCDVVSDFKQKHMNGAELHYARNSHNQHLRFFRYMHDKEYFFVAVAMNKKKMLKRKPHILASKKIMLQHSINRLFDEIHPYWDNPLVLMDKNTRRVDKALRRHLFKAFGSRHKGDIQAIKNVIFVDSRHEPLVQLADYVAGAVRHHVDDRYTSTTYEDCIADKGKIIHL